MRTLALRLALAVCLVEVAALTVALRHMGPGAPAPHTAAITALVLCLGLLGPPSLCELWLRARADEGRRLPLAAAALLLWLVSWLGLELGQAQAGYLLALWQGATPGEALSAAVWRLRAQPLAALVVGLTLPVAASFASLRALGEVGFERRAGWLGGVLVVGVLAWLAMRIATRWSALLLLPALALGLAVATSLGYQLAAQIQTYLFPHDDPEDAPETAPLPAPNWTDWLLLGGGPAGLVATFTWLGLGLLFALGLGRHWAAGLCALAWLVHIVLASNLPMIHLARGEPERALALARHLRHARRKQPKVPGQARQLRLYREVEVRALLALGRAEAAREGLPEALFDPARSGFADHASRLRLSHAFLQRGHPETCLEILEGVPREPARVDLGLQAEVLAGIAEAALDRPAEALARTEALLERARGARSRAAVLNNCALFALSAGEDPAAALQRAEEACELLSREPLLAGTRGAALVALGRFSEALPLLEAVPLERRGQPLLSPHGESMHGLNLAKCYAALDRPAEARAQLERSAAALPGSVPAEEARTLLAAT